MDPLARIDAERACERVVMRYALAVNDWDLDAFVGLFTPDGVWQRPACQALEGHDQIRAFMEGQPKRRTLRHVNGLCMVTIGDDGMSASSISQTTVYDTRDHVVLPVPMKGPDMVVEYRDKLRKVDGGWYLARRDTSVIFSAHT